MSQKFHSKNSTKKLQDSYSDKYSDSDQDDTKIQPYQEPIHQKTHSKTYNKIQSNSIHLKKQEEDSYKKTQFNQKLKTLKKQQDDQREENYYHTQPYNYAVKKIQIKKKKEEPQQDLKPKPDSSRNKQKRTRNDKKSDQMENKANQLMDQIDEAYELDVDLYAKRKTADKKLKCILDLNKKLKQIQLAKYFLKLGGMNLFVRWLYPNDQTGQQTSLTVKIQLMNLLLDLNVSKNNIYDAEQLQQSIKKYRRSKYKILKEVSEKIVEKWKIIKATQSG